MLSILAENRPFEEMLRGKELIYIKAHMNKF
jgi:hypothetical protein